MQLTPDNPFAPLNQFTPVLTSEQVRIYFVDDGDKHG